MGVIATNSNKITLIYNGDNSIGKQTVGYVESASKDILTKDTSKTKITGTQWAEIADNLQLSICNLVDQNHPNFIKIYGDEKVDITADDCIKILQNSPETLAYAILINGNEFHLIKTPSDVEKYLEIKSNNSNQ
ncbi:MULTISPECIES: hypothetical protein [unclassified Cellulophaga]|uniref:hypothetical protein n=1 Tax=unclassified Cellulophaga TaxID=2634405 RepID=UPI0026E11A32|nr:MULTISPECIES: hypothetical protein [unclassified Cellulophaga]MDO6489971.1 hypothetical protein [Cellulophaga sp. 2_MG-2023]MDO6494835.1 hypothetical protein [Cellulophaga sp. 3_MG-2023]